MFHNNVYLQYWSSLTTSICTPFDHAHMFQAQLSTSREYLTISCHVPHLCRREPREAGAAAGRGAERPALLGGVAEVRWRQRTHRVGAGARVADGGGVDGGKTLIGLICGQTEEELTAAKAWHMARYH